MTDNNGGCLEAMVETKVDPSSYLDEGQLAAILETEGMTASQETKYEVSGQLGRCWRAE